MASRSDKRIQRRQRADALSITCWDQTQQNFLGTIEPAIWFEDVTQILPRSDYEWQDMRTHTQLCGWMAEGLLPNIPQGPGSFYVTFTQNGVSYLGASRDESPRW